MRKKTITLVGFVEQYIANRDVTDNYKGNLRKRALKLSRFGGTAAMKKLLTEEMVNEFLASLDLNPRTVRSYRTDIVSLWNGAADLDLVPYPILRRIRRPKCPELLIDCYTFDEVRKLLAAAKAIDWALDLRGSHEYPNGVTKSEYWTAAIRLAWDTGIRRGDVWLFRKSAIRPDRTARIVQHKTGQAVTVRLRQGTIDALNVINHDRPCRWTLNASFFGRHFKQLVAESGVNRGSFKWLRRSSGSYVEMGTCGAGGKHLGHADPRVFDRHYDAKLGGHLAPQPPDLDGDL